MRIDSSSWCLFVASLSIVSAFSPSTNNVIHGKAQRSTLFNKNVQLNLAAAALPNPMKKLPWNIEAEQKREDRRLRQEAALLYRDLGVAEDATYEEIQEATSILLARYEGDIKKKVKIEMTKDKIMQIRLNQRLGGMIRESKDARANAYLRDDADEWQNRPKEWQPPAWTQGLVVKPNQTWRDNCIIFFGGLTALGIFLPSQAEGIRVLSFLLSAAFLGNRGTPEQETGTGMRGKVGSHTFLAFGIAFVAYIFMTSIASAVANAIPNFVENKMFYSLQNTMVAIFMGFVTAYIQPYKKESVKKDKNED